MITWTESARSELERHVATVRTRMIAAGADADEVAADLERHVETELAEAKIGVATHEDVRRVLARMGAVEAGLLPEKEVERDDRPAGAGAKADRRFYGFVTLCCIVFGVLLPAVALGFEYFTRLCSAEMFDPMPTVLHAVLIALVPVANALALSHAARRQAGKIQGPAPRWLGVLNGAAVAIAGIYALMFVIITPFAVVGIIAFGLGLLPLAPLFSLITALICRRRLRIQAGGPALSLPGWKQGLVGGLLVLTALETQSLLTEAGIRMARSEAPETVRSGIALLRKVGDEEQLLQRCYPRNAAAVDLVGYLFSLGASSSSGDVGGLFAPERTDWARVLYYRVTGTPFNHVPVPARFRFGASPRAGNEWVWDENAGGEVVGQRLKNLALAESRIDGTLDADTLTSYVEWTLVFKNTALWQQEARAQILLPPGGVVSRLTLWVNGEEREAAFAGRAQVREAYQKVAIRQRRDPVLVTTKGADRVLMQCFPVPVNGEMKVRVGMTAPLIPAGEGRALVKLPEIIEQNFRMSPEFTHSVWLESAGPIVSTPGGLKADKDMDGRWSAHGEMAAGAAGFPVLTLSGSAERAGVWAVHSEMPGRVIHQTLRAREPEQGAGQREMVVVVDGSKSLAPYVAEIADVIASQERGARITLLLAGDEVVACPDHEPARAARWLRSQTLRGGQDNLDALVAAWDVAAAGGGEVLWLHGAQPCGWQALESLLQREARRPGRVRFRAFPVARGAQVILEKLDGVSRVTAAPRIGTLTEDLRGEFLRVLKGDEWSINRTCEQGDPRAGGGAVESPQAGREDKGAHIARLWAADEVRRLMGDKRAEAVALAGKFQLVTPVSGAVVLETQQQFDEAGLKAVDPSTAPTIPEPATVALILGGVALVFVVWTRKGRRRGLSAVSGG